MNCKKVTTWICGASSTEDMPDCSHYISGEGPEGFCKWMNEFGPTGWDCLCKKARPSLWKRMLRLSQSLRGIWG